MAADDSVEGNSLLTECQMLSDEQVVARGLAGQTALFEVLIRRHCERLYRTIRAITQDDQRVDGLIEEAYVDAFARLRDLDAQQRFATWLTRIAIARTAPHAALPAQLERVRA
jgi:RNA polymerase sigma-70 factor (ECF subfamily)